MLKSVKKVIRNYFGFSKSQTNGFLVLMLFMLVMLFTPRIYRKLTMVEYDQLNEDRHLLDSIMQVWNKNFSLSDTANVSPALELFMFDPNLATIEQLVNLGLKPFMAQRVENYRKAGGKFSVKSDLLKIYGFSEQDYTRLKGYINLPEVVEKKTIFSNTRINAVKREPELSPDEPKTTKPSEIFIPIDINSADTIEWQRLKGIGPGFSSRIVKYRTLLGGFSSANQVGEVYGISDSLFNQIKRHLMLGDTTQIRKININLATFKEINAHPYISYEQTREIMNGKSKYGKFYMPEDLLKLSLFDSAQIIKLKPYLEFR